MPNLDPVHDETVATEMPELHKFFDLPKIDSVITIPEGATTTLFSLCFPAEIGETIVINWQCDAECRASIDGIETERGAQMIVCYEAIATLEIKATGPQVSHGLAVQAFRSGSGGIDDGAADPSYTIDEDDRIGALIEAHSELTASVLRTLGHLTTAVEGMSRAVESLAARLDPLTSTVNELADGAGLASVDEPDEVSLVIVMEEEGIAERRGSMSGASAGVAANLSPCSLT